MKISNLINDYGKEYSPYMGNLVNHLPMAQFALFKMTDDVEKVKLYTESHMKRAKINQNYPGMRYWKKHLNLQMFTL